MPLDHLYKANLSLGGLDMSDLSRERVHTIRDRSEKRVADYKAKYGDKWHERWEEDYGDGSDEDIDASLYNGMILYGTRAGCSNHYMLEQLEVRMRELYGDEYETLENHQPWDGRVVELLLSEAVRTGKWKRLPKELWSEYHKRAGAAT